MRFKLRDEMIGEEIQIAPAVVLVMRDILKREQFPIDQREHFWIIGLSPNNGVSFIELVALGDYDQVKMTSHDVFRVAIIKNAPKLIFVHNHPTGGLKPSRADKHATLCLLRIAEVLGMDVIDHIILSDNGYFSFADEGLLDEIKLSDEYRLLDKPKYDQLKFELKQAGKVEAIFQEKILVTKKMAELGIDEALIKKVTGLDPELV